MSVPADAIRLVRRGSPLQRGARLLAASLLLISFVILLWPVTSSVGYDGKFTADGTDGAEWCGVTITQAFVVPRGDFDRLRDKKIDCAAKARDLAGPGALFLLLALAPAFVVLLAPGSSSGADQQALVGAAPTPRTADPSAAG